MRLKIFQERKLYLIFSQIDDHNFNVHEKNPHINFFKISTVFLSIMLLFAS